MKEANAPMPNFENFKYFINLLREIVGREKLPD